MKRLFELTALVCLYTGMGYCIESAPNVHVLGGTTLIDGSVEASKQIQTDTYYEYVNVSTPTTPKANHARMWFDRTNKQICAIFDDGTGTCFANSNLVPPHGGPIFSNTAYVNRDNNWSHSQTSQSNSSWTFLGPVEILNTLSIGITNIPSVAVMDVASSSQGILIPELTTVQKNLIASSATATIQIVQSTFTTQQNTNPKVATIASTNAHGLIVVMSQGGNYISGITDNIGNFYSEAPNSKSDNGLHNRTDIWYSSNTSAGVTSLSISFTITQNSTLQITELSGVAQSFPLDVSSNTFGNGGTTALGPNLAITKAGDFLVGAVSKSAVDPTGVVTPWTVFPFTPAFEFIYSTPGILGVYQATYTPTSTDIFGASGAAFLPAPISSNVPVGLIVYDTNLNVPQYWDGSVWRDFMDTPYLSTGTLPNYVIASSIAVNTVYPGQVNPGFYTMNVTTAANLSEQVSLSSGVIGLLQNTNLSTGPYHTLVDSSTYSFNAATATYALTSSTANYSLTSGTANYSNSAGTATFALTSTTATYSLNATTATYALLASTANVVIEQINLSTGVIGATLTVNGVNYSFPSTGTIGNVLEYISTNTLQWVSTKTFAGSSTTPGGGLYAIQSNNPAGTFYGDGNFTYTGSSVSLSYTLPSVDTDLLGLSTPNNGVFFDAFTTNNSGAQYWTTVVRAKSSKKQQEAGFEAYSSTDVNNSNFLIMGLNDDPTNTNHFGHTRAAFIDLEVDGGAPPLIFALYHYNNKIWDIDTNHNETHYFPVNFTSTVSVTVTPGEISPGTLGSGVIASSIAVNTVYPGQVTVGTYTITVSTAIFASTVPANGIQAGSLGSNVIASSIAIASVGPAQTTGIDTLGSTQTISASKTFTSTTTFAQAITFSTGTYGIIGSTNGAFANTGYVGEFVDASQAGTINTGASSIWANIITISLSPGDWIVGGSVQYSFVSGTVFTNNICGAVSLFSGNTITDHVAGKNVQCIPGTSGPTSVSDLSLPTLFYNINIVTTSTIYLKGESGFTGSTPKFYGYIQARRLR